MGRFSKRLWIELTNEDYDKLKEQAEESHRDVNGQASIYVERGIHEIHLVNKAAQMVLVDTAPGPSDSASVEVIRGGGQE